MLMSRRVGAWLSLVERTVRDREVGGSNPLAPTNNFKHLRLPAKVAVLVLWQDCGRRAILLLRRLPFSLDRLRECNAASFADRSVPSDRQSSLHCNQLPPAWSRTYDASHANAGFQALLTHKPFRTLS